MIPRRLLAVLFTLFTVSNLYAQHATINGQIKNITGNPLTGASVILYHSPDSLLVKTGVTDNKGNFEISQVKTGKYFLRYNFIGYTTASTGTFFISAGEKLIAATQYLNIRKKNEGG